MSKTNQDIIKQLQSYSDQGDLKKLEELLNKLESPFPNPIILPAINVVMQYCNKKDFEKFENLVKTYESKFQHKIHFYKQLQQKLIFSTHNNWKQERTEKVLLPFKYIIDHQENFNPPAIQLIGLCEKYLRLEKYEKVIETLEKFTENFKEQQELRNWIFIIAKSLQAEKVVEPENTMIPNDIHLKNSVLHYNFGEEKCLIWFGGIVLYPMAKVFKYLLPLLQKYQISLLVVLDKRFMASIWGINESFPYRKKTISELDHLVDKLGYKEIATYGSSGGGLAALMYGLEMKVKGIFGINVLTHTPQNKVRESKNIADIHRKVILDNARELEDIDCVPLITNNKEIKVMLLYSENSKIDKDYNKRIEKFSNVLLKPENHDKHVMYGYLEENNILDKRFDDFFKHIDWN